jgi:hypothetical protein
MSIGTGHPEEIRETTADPPAVSTTADVADDKDEENNRVRLAGVIGTQIRPNQNHRCASRID